MIIETTTGTPRQFTRADPARIPLTIFDTKRLDSHNRIPVTVYRPEQHLNYDGEISHHYAPRSRGCLHVQFEARQSLRLVRKEGDAYSTRVAVIETGELEEWDLSKGPQLIQREREELARKADYRARCRRERILEAKTCDPETVHENQSGLTEFEDTDQADVNPASTSATDDRLDGLPVFIDESELPDGPGVTDPALTGPDRCDRCGASHPWAAPLERGLSGIRGGGIVDGNSDYEHCDPADFDSHIVSCHCCGCPQCSAKSIRYRTTMEVPWACHNPDCRIEFSKPVERPDVIRDDVDTDEEKRARLYWECRSCGEPTQAPFTGIPEDLL